MNFSKNSTRCTCSGSYSQVGSKARQYLAQLLYQIIKHLIDKFCVLKEQAVRRQSK